MTITWNPWFLWAILALVVFIFFLVLGIRARRRRLKLRKQLSSIAYLLQLEKPHIRLYPVLTLHGRYFSYEVALECKVTRDGTRQFRLHVNLVRALEGRLYIQSESKPARIAKLYGMEVIITGNSNFDHQVMVCCTDEASAQLILTPYLIERFLRAELPSFHMDFHEKQLYAELSLHPDDPIVKVAHWVAIAIELAEFIHQGQYTLRPFTPPPMAA